MSPEEEIQRQLDQDAAIAKLGHKAMKPHPGGLLGRIVDAHHDGDEMLAKALTDALLAEEESPGTAPPHPGARRPLVGQLGVENSFENYRAVIPQR